MVNKTKIAIIKAVLESEEISKYTKDDIIKIIVATEVEEPPTTGISYKPYTITPTVVDC